MGEFSRVAENISSTLRDIGAEGGIKPETIPDIVSDALGRGNNRINCYPGVPGYGCHDLAVFVSLTSPVYKGNRQKHLNCRQAIEKIVQHMQGLCIDTTRYAVLITDSWDPDAFNDWKANLQQIKNHAHIEIYLLAGPSVSEISI